MFFFPFAPGAIGWFSEYQPQLRILPSTCFFASAFPRPILATKLASDCKQPLRCLQALFFLKFPYWFFLKSSRPVRSTPSPFLHVFCPSSCPFLRPKLPGRSGRVRTPEALFSFPKTPSSAFLSDSPLDLSLLPLFSHVLTERRAVLIRHFFFPPSVSSRLRLGYSGNSYSGFPFLLPAWFFFSRAAGQTPSKTIFTHPFFPSSPPRHFNSPS